MKFVSQIATTRVQSERLIALGLKKETADMGWWSHTVDWCGIVNEDKRQWHLSIRYVEPIDARMETLPAWSLHRLWELNRINRIELDSEDEIASLYDEVINNIEAQIKAGNFNKEHLYETT